MTIAFDISPIDPNSGHTVRGIGTYVRQLHSLFPKYDQKNSYAFFSKQEDISSKADIIHYPYFDLFARNNFVINHKTVITIHDLTPLVFPENFPVGIRGKVNWQMNKRKLKKAGGIITDSKASKKDIVRLVGIPENRVHVVYLAAGEQFAVHKPSMSNAAAFRKKYALPDQLVLYVGDATWNKNLPNLVDAIKEVNLTLVFAGKAIANNDFDINHPWNRSLVLAKEKMKGDKRFITLGYIPDEDLVTLYNIADVTVLPSLYEGFGLPVLEAMQCGSPVVTTKMGSLPEIAGDAAMYVDPYDVVRIGNGISEIVSSESLRGSLIEKGIIQAKNFTWKKTIDATVQVYSKI
jgi:glycosyltransferase involved in cell wall biosynthesis